jgi:hypothetical protein
MSVEMGLVTALDHAVSIIGRATRLAEAVEQAIKCDSGEGISCRRCGTELRAALADFKATAPDSAKGESE